MQTVLLTIDVEDWFQVENLRPVCPRSSWDSYELRVEGSTRRVLDLLDSVTVHGSSISSPKPSGSQRQISQPSSSSGASDSRSKTSSSPSAPLTPGPMPSSSSSRPHAPSSMPSPSESRKPRATFFVLGWLAERLPGLVREIRDRGHEVASHGHDHELCSRQTVQELRRDLQRSKELLEDILGEPVLGYRAPGFSADGRVANLVREAGYVYDSSFNSFSLNPRHGKMPLQSQPDGSSLRKLSPGFFEIPISNLSILGVPLPWGGGGYFRLYPGGLFQAGVRRLLQRQGDYVFYLHPWEADPGQPRERDLGPLASFRHYHNLDRVLPRLRSLLDRFSSCWFPTCREYLEANSPGDEPRRAAEPSVSGQGNGL